MRLDRGFRVRCCLSKGIGASLLARVRDGSELRFGIGGRLSCSLEALLARPVRGCRRLDEVAVSCAWDFVDRSRVFGFSGDCFSGESGSLKEAGST